MKIGDYQIKKAFKMPYWSVFLNGELVSNYHGSKMNAIELVWRRLGDK